MDALKENRQDNARESSMELTPEAIPTAVPLPPPPAWLKEAFSAQPLAPMVVPPPATVEKQETPPPAEPNDGSARNFSWSNTLPWAAFLAVAILVIYIAPGLLHNWRVSEAKAEAEAAYLKRRAELRAEAEHADARLVELDKRVDLVSLGFREVVRKFAPLVVTVTNLVDPRNREHDPFGPRLIMIYDREKDREYQQISIGSGFIARPGIILTNHHVIDGAHRLRITFASGKSIGVDRSAVSSDELTDLAIIRLPAKLPEGVREEVQAEAKFADSDKDVQVGDLSLAIGSPLGLDRSVSHGVISAKGRLTNWVPVELLQTDAAIKPGNSGGPLLDLRGWVVGVNVAITGERGPHQGIGFAIPSNTAKKVCDKLVEKGEVPRGFLGIGFDDPAGNHLVRLGKLDGGGVRIAHVMHGEAAFTAGLRVGDIIVRCNNEILAHAEPGRHLRQLVASIDPGTEINLEIIRNGQRLRIPVVVGKRPALQP